MPSKCIFLCGIHNVEVREDIEDGILLLPNEKNEELPAIKLTNNKDRLKSLLGREFQILVGAIEFNHLKDGYPLIAFSEGEFDLKTTNSIQHLDLHLFLLKMYFFCLWLVKDNAADFDVGFLQFMTEESEYEVSSNNMSSSNFNTEGFRTSASFSIDELSQAATYLKESIYIEHKNKPKFANVSSLDKVSISTYFIQSALASKDLGIKAIGYCSALETLFSNGENTELSHKLSERISKFLESDANQRKALYKTIKKIYDIRSKVVHGATYKPQKEGELAGLIKQADEICRRVMIYAYSTPEKDNIFDKSRDDLEEYFLDLVLS